MKNQVAKLFQKNLSENCLKIDASDKRARADRYLVARGARVREGGAGARGGRRKRRGHERGHASMRMRGRAIGSRVTRGRQARGARFTCAAHERVLRWGCASATRGSGKVLPPRGRSLKLGWCVSVLSWGSSLGFEHTCGCTRACLQRAVIGNFCYQW